MNPRTASTSLLLGAIRLAPRQPSNPYAIRAVRTVAASAKLSVDELDRWFSAKLRELRELRHRAGVRRRPPPCQSGRLRLSARPSKHMRGKTCGRRATARRLDR
jgi:hypothetical protein